MNAAGQIFYDSVRIENIWAWTSPNGYRALSRIRDVTLNTQQALDQILRYTIVQGNVVHRSVALLLLFSYIVKVP